MYACIPVPLLRSATGLASDETIRTAFQQLGFETRYDEAKIDVTTGHIRIGPTSCERLVPVGSTDHHRDLGRRNLPADAPAAIRGEIERFAVFTGASTLFQANLFVTRVTGGEMSIWCYQSELERLLPLCRQIGNDLCRPPLLGLVDLAGLHDVPARFVLYSGQAGAVISRGHMHRRRPGSFVRSRATDVGLLLLTLATFVVSFGLHFVPVDQRGDGNAVTPFDPLGSTLRAFAENSWPSALVAAVTLLTTLLIAYTATPRHHIAWTWKEGG